MPLPSTVTVGRSVNLYRLAVLICIRVSHLIHQHVVAADHVSDNRADCPHTEENDRNDQNDQGKQHTVVTVAPSASAPSSMRAARRPPRRISYVPFLIILPILFIIYAAQVYKYTTFRHKARLQFCYFLQLPSALFCLFLTADLRQHRTIKAAASCAGSGRAAAVALREFRPRCRGFLRRLRSRCRGALPYKSSPALQLTR